MTQKVVVPYCTTDYSPLVPHKPNKIRWILSILLIIVFFIWVGIFVIVPITFMLSKDFQTSAVLPRWSIPASNFTDFKRYGLNGVRNFYIPLENNITLGVWHILPKKLINTTENNLKFETSLWNSSFPVLIFFHGNARVRSGSVDIYKIQRRFFHIIAFDYRGYGDSSDGEMTEDNIVQDSVQIYKWVCNNTNSDVFVWGHSLGTGIGVITMARLRTHGIQPKGVILETPFTSSRDVILNSKISKIFSWLPWFEATILDPVDKSGLAFNVTKYITKLDCPIMIFHAEDDNVIPYKLGKQLYDLARDYRNNSENILFYTFDGHLKYGHGGIYRDPRLSAFIGKFLDLCGTTT